MLLQSLIQLIIMLYVAPMFPIILYLMIIIIEDCNKPMDKKFFHSKEFCMSVIISVIIGSLIPIFNWWIAWKILKNNLM